MLRVKDAVIVSAPKKYLTFLTVITGVLFLLGFGIYQKSLENKLSVNGQTFDSESVITPAAHQRGLSGRESIGDKNAMVFVFDESKQRCFWMKDMKFNIDMVWLDTAKKVVAVEPNVKPESYPNNYCHENAQYVVEFTAGTANRLNIKAGDQVSLK